jgi:SAM-dependent methyltransferase
MTEVFVGGYAQAYDALYADKDYEGECDLIQQVLGIHGAGPTRSILDLGCGTGGHALELARRGYEVVGVDRSRGMLEVAEEKAGRAGLAATFALGDVREIDLKRSFDAVLMMFAVLCYQRENADVFAALATAALHLRPGGLCLFDVWYGPAVLAERPRPRMKTVPLDGAELRRAADGVLDTRRHLCTVTYHLEHRVDGDVVAETDEVHEIRYFFPLELELFLNGAGLSLVELTAFPALEREPDESTWNVLVVARAQDGV